MHMACALLKARTGCISDGKIIIAGSGPYAYGGRKFDRMLYEYIYSCCMLIVYSSTLN